MPQAVPVQPIEGELTVNPGTTPVPVALDPVTDPIPVELQPKAATPFHLISEATTNATLISADPGKVLYLTAHNTTSGEDAATLCVRLYDVAEAPNMELIPEVPGEEPGTPAVPADVPILTFPVAAGSTFTLDMRGYGITFENGIGLAITGAAADDDNTAIGAGDAIVNLLFTA